MRRVIEAYLRYIDQAIDYQQALDPVGDRRFGSGTSSRPSSSATWRRRSCLGETGSGVKAALGIWYDVRQTLGSVLQFGGLTPDSHRKLIEFYYPRLKRVAFGPPIVNIEKLLALVRAGLLDFSVARSPRVLTDEAGGCFELRCEYIPGAVARATVLVGARYPSTDIPRESTRLYHTCCRRGWCGLRESRDGPGSARYSRERST